MKNLTKNKKITPFKIFDKDSYESPPSTPRRQLFSGGKTSHRRKRTPKTKKKTRKNKRTDKLILKRKKK